MTPLQDVQKCTKFAKHLCFLKGKFYTWTTKLVENQSRNELLETHQKGKPENSE